MDQKVKLWNLEALKKIYLAKLLSRVRWFDMLTASKLTALGRIMEIEAFPANRAIFEEGELAVIDITIPLPEGILLRDVVEIVARRLGEVIWYDDAVIVVAEDLVVIDLDGFVNLAE